MDTFPLTPNDKTDRNAIALIEVNFDGAGAGDYVAPRTAGEAQVCFLFGEVLGIDLGKVSALDSFFDLGGHSLLVVYTPTASGPFFIFCS
jgi:hypothetical protein